MTRRRPPPRPRDLPAPALDLDGDAAARHGGHRQAAEFFLGRGADMNWVGYDSLTPLEAARRSGAGQPADWLASRGAKPTG
jgi:hypothetical protein